jgi:hypothetical protein
MVFFCLNVEEANAMEIEIRRITIIKESAKLKISLMQLALGIA